MGDRHHFEAARDLQVQGVGDLVDRALDDLLGLRLRWIGIQLECDRIVLADVCLETLRDDDDGGDVAVLHRLPLGVVGAFLERQQRDAGKRSPDLGRGGRAV